MIAQNAQTNAEHHRTVELHQGLEGELIAPLDEALQELRVRHPRPIVEERGPAESPNQPFRIHPVLATIRTPVSRTHSLLPCSRRIITRFSGHFWKCSRNITERSRRGARRRKNVR